jgi:hypothetical protein
LPHNDWMDGDHEDRVRGGHRITMTRAKQFRKNVFLAGLALAILLTCAPTKAYGYVDPGSGTFLYQAMYAVFIGGVFYCRKLIQKIRRKNRKAGD